MAVVVAVACLGLALVVAVCFAALLEVFRQLSDIRLVLNLQDEPTPIELRARGLNVEEMGLLLPLANEPKAIVVFLSTKCGTCLSIADAFRGGSPQTVWFVIADSPEAPDIAAILSASGRRVMIDVGDATAERIGLSVTPSVLTVVFGTITRAQSV